MPTLFSSGAGGWCPTCSNPLLDGRCPVCAAAQSRTVDSLRRHVITQMHAVRLLEQHCRIRCQRTVVAMRGTLALVRWRVDLPDGRTTVLSSSTLLLMAEKRLPAGVWPVE